MTLASSSRRPWWECHQKDVHWSHEDSPYVCHEKPHGHIWQPDKTTIKRQSNRSWTLDLADLLKKFQTDHIPMKDGNVLKKLVVHGDQLMEQSCNAQWIYKLGGNRSRTSWRVGVHISEFHQKMCMHEVQWLKVVYSTTVRIRYFLTCTV